jgi:hypothetical protein
MPWPEHMSFGFRAPLLLQQQLCGSGGSWRVLTQAALCAALCTAVCAALCAALCVALCSALCTALCTAVCTALCTSLCTVLCLQVQPQDLQPLTFASHTHEKFHLLMPLYGKQHSQPVQLRLLLLLLLLPQCSHIRGLSLETRTPITICGALRVCRGVECCKRSGLELRKPNTTYCVLRVCRRVGWRI